MSDSLERIRQFKEQLLSVLTQQEIDQVEFWMVGTQIRWSGPDEIMHKIKHDFFKMP